MNNFEIALQKTLKWEGGYQAHSNDPGNFNSAGELIGTNFGISAPVLEAYMATRPTKEDMQNLSLKTAAEIYRRDYWSAIRGDDIQDADLAALLFDMAVNHGPASALRTVQRAIGVKHDGKIGPVTIAALNSAQARSLITKVIDERIKLYQRIIARRPAMKVFSPGWIKRALSFSPK